MNRCLAFREFKKGKEDIEREIWNSVRRKGGKREYKREKRLGKEGGSGPYERE